MKTEKDFGGKSVHIMKADSIDLSPKDVIMLSKWEDFVWLIKTALDSADDDDEKDKKEKTPSEFPVFKLGNMFYIVTGEVVYAYNDG